MSEGKFYVISMFPKLLNEATNNTNKIIDLRCAKNDIDANYRAGNPFILTDDQIQDRLKKLKEITTSTEVSTDPIYIIVDYDVALRKAMTIEGIPFVVFAPKKHSNKKYYIGKVFTEDRFKLTVNALMSELILIDEYYDFWINDDVDDYISYGVCRIDKFYYETGAVLSDFILMIKQTYERATRLLNNKEGMVNE